MRRALVTALLVAAAAPLSGAAARGGIGLSASPLRLTLQGAGSAAITVRNPGLRPLVVDVSRAGLARSLRGRPRVRPARGAADWLRLSPRRLRLAPGAVATLRLVSAPPRRAAPGDHPAVVLLTTRPVGARHVRVRLRLGVVVVLHVPGRIVRRLDLRALVVRRRGPHRLLELRLVNRGNVTEPIAGRRLRVVLLRRGHELATLRPRRRELLPHTTGIVEFPYRGHVRGRVVARVEILPPARGRDRSFRVGL